MRSDTIRVNTSGAGMEQALAQTEAVSVFKGLSHKDALRLRLLCEEMMGMFRSLTGEVEADFFIEDEDNDFRLHLFTVTDMNNEKRRKLLQSATKGKNSAAVGIMGKLRDLFEKAFEPVDDTMPAYFTVGWVESELDYYGSSAAWSLMQYRDCMSQDKTTEEWDELEKSVVANLADEVKVFIKGNNVELVIYKKF